MSANDGIRDGAFRKDKLDVGCSSGTKEIISANQHSDINKTHEILQDESKCEMIVIMKTLSSSANMLIFAARLGHCWSRKILFNDYAGNMISYFLQPVKLTRKFGTQTNPIDPE